MCKKFALLVYIVLYNDIVRQMFEFFGCFPRIIVSLLTKKCFNGKRNFKF